jgi:hypothetical protein
VISRQAKAAEVIPLGPESALRRSRRWRERQAHLSPSEALIRLKFGFVLPNPKIGASGQDFIDRRCGLRGGALCSIGQMIGFVLPNPKIGASGQDFVDRRCGLRGGALCSIRQMIGFVLPNPTSIVSAPGNFCSIGAAAFARWLMSV